MAPTKDANKLPAVGSRVRCEGLTGPPELNGCLGVVLGHDREGGRATVGLEGPDPRVVVTVGVQPQNLVGATITDASPLLGRLIGELPLLFFKEVLPLLDPTDLALLARAARPIKTKVPFSS